MDCRRIEDEAIIERYIIALLSEQETEAFEQHYLGCQRCFAELKLRHAAAIELSHQPIPVRPTRSWWAPFSWQWGLAVTAVALLGLAVLYLRPVEQSHPAEQTAAVQQPSAAVLEQLASIDQIPPYIPGLIRGGQTDPALIKFQQGMDLYSMQKYSEAIVPLAEAARLDPDRQIIAFYLGISYLVSGNASGAIEQLSKVTKQENPYSEEGHWFLAKAYLKQRDFRSARMELQTVESLHGSHSTPAQDLLKQIEKF